MGRSQINSVENWKEWGRHVSQVRQSARDAFALALARRRGLGRGSVPGRRVEGRERSVRWLLLITGLSPLAA
jgi:hypothetical protein